LVGLGVDLFTKRVQMPDVIVDTVVLDLTKCVEPVEVEAVGANCPVRNRYK